MEMSDLVAGITSTAYNRTGGKEGCRPITPKYVAYAFGKLDIHLLVYSVDAEYMIHCSAAFVASANTSGAFLFEERGTINVKV